MLMYALICLSLALVGIAGLQFTYLFYLDRVDKERKKLIHDLEVECRRLSERLLRAETTIVEQKRLLEMTKIELEDGEVWADVIEDR
jgi:hypothetical protein